MKRWLFVSTLCLFLGIKLCAQQTHIENQWLVILSGSETYEEAVSAQRTYEQETNILSSGDYDNLNPGWHINCIPFTEKQAAIAQSRRLKAAGVNAYVKYSGAYTQRADYLLDHHFLVYGKYLITEHTIDLQHTGDIIGYERTEGSYVVQASVPQSALPADVSYLQDKPIEVYSLSGERTTARVTGFMAINMVLPHFGTIQQWQEEELSDREKTASLLKLTQGEPFLLVATLELSDGFDGEVAHISGNQGFLPYELVTDPSLEKRAIERYFQSSAAKEHDALLKKSIQEDGAYSGEETPPISPKAYTFRVGTSTYVFLQVVYGDWLAANEDGYYYASMMGVWKAATDEFEIREGFDSGYSPLFVKNGDTHILGLQMDDKTTVFQYPDWKTYRSLEILNFDCNN